MASRSRIAPASEMRSFGERGGKARRHPARAALRPVAAVAVLGLLLYLLPRHFGAAGALQARAMESIAYAAAAGAWVRAALVGAFQSIPVWW